MEKKIIFGRTIPLKCRQTDSDYSPARIINQQSRPDVMTRSLSLHDSSLFDSFISL